MRIGFIVFGIFALGAVAQAADSKTSPLRVAALFAPSTGPEYICVARAFQKISREEGHNFTIDIIAHDNSIADLVQKTQLIVNNKYDVVIGPRTSQEAIASTPILTAAMIPQLLPVASYQIPAQAGERFTIAMLPDSERYGMLSAKMIKQKLNSKHILVVVNESQPYSTNYAALLPRHLELLDYTGTIQYIKYIEGSANYDKIAETAKNSHFDLIYAPLYGVDTVNLYSALAKRNVSTTVFGRGGIFELKDILRRQYSPTLKLIFNGIWDNTLRGPYSQQFQKLMKESCRDFEVGVRSATGFDSLRLLLDTVTRHPHLRGAALAQAIITQPFSGLLGTRTFDPITGALLLPMPVFEHAQNGFKLFEIVN